MGSELQRRHATQGDALATARARRTLAASRAARDGISTMVDALRISKPPRAPPKPASSPSSNQAARRHALIPLAEGRAELEARIHALEDQLAQRDADIIKLKRQWGRSLVKRRHSERERDSALAQFAPAAEYISSVNSVILHARRDAADLASNVTEAADAIRRVVASGTDKIPSVARDDISAALDDINDIVQEALKSQQQAPQLPQFPQLLPTPPIHSASKMALAASDDDAHSVQSFASSAHDNHESQVETLLDLVALLESKLANTPSHPTARSVIARARRTASMKRSSTSEDLYSVIRERDSLSEMLKAMKTQNVSSTSEEDATKSTTIAEVELTSARKELSETKERLAALEKIAERAICQDDLLARNAALENELRSAKKTVGRLIQERNALRRTAPSTPNHSHASYSSRTPRLDSRNSSDAMRRILDWRQRASSESPESMHGNHIPNGSLSRGHDGPSTPELAKRFNRTEVLPDRTENNTEDDGPSYKYCSNGTAADVLKDNTSLSAKSSEIAVNDDFSARSLPVRGFLKRHDSFLSAGDVSASGDEITIMNRRNMFQAGSKRIDGLRGLLGGP